MSFNALVAKGHLEHRRGLQEDNRVPDAHPLLAWRKGPHEQLILDRMELPIGSRKIGELIQPGVGLQMGQIFCPLHKERVAHTKLLCCCASERKITHLTETISLLQKTELLEDSITVADFAQSAPQQMGNIGPRHEVHKSNYEGDQGWV
jgi:hypothetical protein